MDAEAKAPRDGCLTSHCKTLDITAKYEDEQKFLAAFYSAMCSGGVIIIARVGHPDISITFPIKK